MTDESKYDCLYIGEVSRTYFTSHGYGNDSVRLFQCGHCGDVTTRPETHYEKHSKTEQKEQAQAEEVPGSWFVWSYDVQPYPEGLFGTELEALQLVEQLGYGHVTFWPHGKTWT